MRTVRITIEFDGDCFFGFQRQPGEHTLQSELEGVLAYVYKAPCPVKYAGRTDRRVNAKAQVVVFDDNGRIPLSNLQQILNKRLSGIQVLSIDEVEKGFDPRRSAKKRQYEYWCYSGERHVFLDRFMWHRPELPIENIKQCLQSFVGVHDFFYLSKLNSQVGSTKREIFKVNVSPRSYEFLGYKGDAVVLTFEANSFLHHMVRKIVGLVWNLAENRLSESDFQDIINVRHRHRFEMAPPQGLYLSKIWYDEGAREFNNEK